MKNYTISLYEQDIEKLKLLVNQEQITLSFAIRQAIKKYITQKEAFQNEISA